MTETVHDEVPAGRPVRLVPTPPGFWRLLLGVCLAAFAPLFGFLLGSTAGSAAQGETLDALYWGLFAGFVLGGLGVVVAVLGGWRLWAHHRRQPPPEEEPR